MKKLRLLPSAVLAANLLLVFVFLLCCGAFFSCSHKVAPTWAYGKYSKDVLSTGDTLVSNAYDSLFIINSKTKDTSWLLKKTDVFVRVDENCINKNPLSVADGDYDALWSAYILRLTVNKKEVEIEIKKGVRGINVPAKIKVANGCIVSMKY